MWTIRCILRNVCFNHSWWSCVPIQCIQIHAFTSSLGVSTRCVVKACIPRYVPPSSVRKYGTELHTVNHCTYLPKIPDQESSTLIRNLYGSHAPVEKETVLCNMSLSPRSYQSVNPSTTQLHYLPHMRSSASGEWFCSPPVPCWSSEDRSSGSSVVSNPEVAAGHGKDPFLSICWMRLA